jgi:hypothetical protein
MPRRRESDELSPDERFREAAALLARAVARACRVKLKSHGPSIPAEASTSQPNPNGQNPRNSTGNGLELPGQTRLSVSDTRGLRLRDEGDKA